jgi:fumarylacetoacetate (FAA) hydrolase
MRYVTYVAAEEPHHARLGALFGDDVVDLERVRSWAQGAKSLSAETLPSTMLELIHAGPGAWAYTHRLLAALKDEDIRELKSAGRGRVGWPLSNVRLLPPLPRPMGLRDFYAFEEHVARARASRGQSVPEAWYQAPVFYFSTPNAAYGHEEVVPIPSYSRALDYELEVACVIGQAGRDIPPERAGAFIFGYMVFNDWSARDEQRREMQVGLGPAKGKDFASSFGPWLVTPDELEDRKTERTGVYDLEMSARVNGERRSRGNWKDVHFSFAEMIARASADVFLLPGEVLGSGTVGSGSLLELTEGEGPWLQPGDVVELEIERLGTLRNVVGAKQEAQPRTDT